MLANREIDEALKDSRRFVDGRLVHEMIDDDEGDSTVAFLMQRKKKVPDDERFVPANTENERKVFLHAASVRGVHLSR